jgi:hypothetical protein
MTARRLAILLPLVLGLAVGARADRESLDAHTAHTPKVIVLDNEHVQPSALELGPHDALVFENHSLQPMLVRFTEPQDMANRIHCGLVRSSAKAKGEAPWQLFAWTNGQLTATIPPGRFASVCSFSEGRYAYLVTRQGAMPRSDAGSGLLPEKGQITVK